MATEPITSTQFSEIPNRENVSTFDTIKYTFLGEIPTVTSDLNTQINTINSNTITSSTNPYPVEALITVEAYYDIVPAGGLYWLSLDPTLVQNNSLKERKFSSVVLLPEKDLGFNTYTLEGVLVDFNATQVRILTTAGSQLSLRGSTRIVILPGGVPSLYSTKPTSSSSPGLQGQSTFDNNYLYFCIADNTWRRIPLSTY